MPEANLQPSWVPTSRTTCNAFYTLSIVSLSIMNLQITKKKAFINRARSAHKFRVKNKNKKKQLYILSCYACSSTRHVHAIRGKTTMHFGSLIWTLNPSERILDTTFIAYRVQRGLYTILGKTSHTFIKLTKHAFAILYTIL